MASVVASPTGFSVVGEVGSTSDGFALRCGILDSSTLAPPLDTGREYRIADTAISVTQYKHAKVYVHYFYHVEPRT